MLLQIYDYMKKKKIASNQQLARELHIDIRALEPMLSCWQRKGVLQAYAQKVCQAACTQCQPPVYYKFVEATYGR